MHRSRALWRVLFASGDRGLRAATPYGAEVHPLYRVGVQGDDSLGCKSEGRVQ